MKESWNDCPVCGREMKVWICENRQSIKCDDLCYIVHFKNSEINFDIINIKSEYPCYQIIRDYSGSSIWRLYLGNKLVSFDYIIDFHKINSIEKINRLLVLL